MNIPEDITPLAERARPKALEEFVGQVHLMGDGRIITNLLEKGAPFSMILWGDPGTGKTTLARLIAERCGLEAHYLSAISSGVADVRAVIKKGRENREMGRQTVLFLDEIHRFNKAQQDSVLGAVEAGDVVLIGATTENPSFEVIPPLLSRLRVLRLNRFSSNEMGSILDGALARDRLLSHVTMEPPVRHALLEYARGDARRMLNLVETAAYLAEGSVVSMDNLREAVQRSLIDYDRSGDRHYDTISAFIKSLRGSDPDAAVYYLAKMVLAGEDPLFIARRMIIFASEDVGNASPQALSIAVSAFRAVQNIGMPEGEIVLSQCAIFLASAPKSNASYLAIKKAKEAAAHGAGEIPLHLRNAPTGLMKKMGFGREYRYPHDYPGHFVDEEYLPEEWRGEMFYRPSGEGSEKAIGERLGRLWPRRYGKKADE